MTHRPTAQELAAGMGIAPELLLSLEKVTAVGRQIDASLKTVPTLEVRSAGKTASVSGPGATRDEQAPTEPTRQR